MWSQRSIYNIIFMPSNCYISTCSCCKQRTTFIFNCNTPRQPPPCPPFFLSGKDQFKSVMVQGILQRSCNFMITTESFQDCVLKNNCYWLSGIQNLQGQQPRKCLQEGEAALSQSSTRMKVKQTIFLPLHSSHVPFVNLFICSSLFVFPSLWPLGNLTLDENVSVQWHLRPIPTALRGPNYSQVKGQFVCFWFACLAEGGS